MIQLDCSLSSFMSEKSKVWSSASQRWNPDRWQTVRYEVLRRNLINFYYLSCPKKPFDIKKFMIHSQSASIFFAPFQQTISLLFVKNSSSMNVIREEQQICVIGMPKSVEYLFLIEFMASSVQNKHVPINHSKDTTHFLCWEVWILIFYHPHWV